MNFLKELTLKRHRFVTKKRCQQKVLFDAGFRLKNSSDTVLGVEKFSSISKHGYIKLYSLQGQ